MKVSSYDEFSKLRTVLLGTFSRDSIALEIQKPNEDLSAGLKLLEKAYPQWYIDEVNEDIENFKNILLSNKVEVLRPEWPFESSQFSSPQWTTTGYDIYNVRDNQIVFGETILSSPPSSRFRQNEYFAFYNIFNSLQQESNANWIFAPKPSLPPGFSLPLNKKPSKLEINETKKHEELSGGIKEDFTYLIDDEIIFDAANIIRIGVDILYLVSSTANLSGFKWLKKFLGSSYRIHLTNTYRSSHLDSTICPLAPGLVLLNGDRVDERTVPEIFSKWEKIYFSDVTAMPKFELEFFKEIREPISKELKSMGFSSPISEISSPWGGLNVFSLSEDTVCVEESQISLIKILESFKLNVIPVKYRHFYTMLGCLHCSTLDLKRDGGLIDYFS